MTLPVPRQLDHRFLATLTIEVDRPVPLGTTPSGLRRFDILKGGSLIGPRIRATILPGGNDSLLQRTDGSYHPDVRLAARTEDDAMLLIQYRGIRTASEDVHNRLLAGEPVPYTDYYLRNAPWFETAAPQYDWLNRIMSVGVGRREGALVIYELFEIL